MKEKGPMSMHVKKKQKGKIKSLESNQRKYSSQKVILKRKESKSKEKIRKIKNKSMIKNIQYSIKRKMFMILLVNCSISLPESFEYEKKSKLM